MVYFYKIITTNKIIKDKLKGKSLLKVFLCYEHGKETIVIESNGQIFLTFKKKAKIIFFRVILIIVFFY